MADKKKLQIKFKFNSAISEKEVDETLFRIFDIIFSSDEPENIETQNKQIGQNDCKKSFGEKTKRPIGSSGAQQIIIKPPTVLRKSDHLDAVGTKLLCQS